MAVSSEVARVVHTANGTATFFSYAPIDGATSANLKVYLFNPSTGVLTLQTLGTDYTFGGGGVTFTAAPPAGRRVILHRVVPLLQPDNYKTNAPFPAVVTENRFDEVVRGIQQINDIAQNRAIILPLGDAGFSTNTLPAVEDRKGRVLYFNATTGDPEAKALADTVTTASPWAQSFLAQPTSAAGLADIGAVAKAGDTMTGPLTLPGPPTAANHAATKDYVDSQITAGPYVLKAGDTMTGALTLPGAPTAALHAATKDYVDARVAKAGDTMTGALTLPGAPTASNHAATKGYVDSTAVAKAGDTMTGFLTLHADPTAAMHAATKQYVDGGYRLANILRYTNPESSSYTKPSNVRALLIRALGGGGGGGGSSSSRGGGAGGYCEIFITNPSATYPYTVGAGGAANGNGGSTTIAGMTAGGGISGNGNGAGGSATGGHINVRGAPAPISLGANSLFGGGGRQTDTTERNGMMGAGGAAGDPNNSIPAGSGGPGYIEIWEFV